MDKQTLAHVKQRLLDERESITKRLEENDHYGMKSTMGETTSELSTYDNHPADIASELFEREKDIALYQLDRETLGEIDQALERMDAGTYGICTVCGKEIPAERLEALPQALTCKEHAPSPAVNNQRPVEEQFMKPAFGRTSLDEKEANTFDGEDAWQIVESWGTSSTPFSFQDTDKTDYNHMYIEADEADGYVEAVEQIGYTDMYGYHGPDSVHFMRSHTYDRYMDQNEGKGIFISYDQYLDDLAKQEADEDIDDLSNL
ncbi:molecular chaperone DnaK [Brevibacillus laterosporus]|uniref:TraR/DksA C4-type zinc finger protein n=1 Tax=Brevibacillus laterosporus TaxID=1465 RepID=UPI0024076BF5|nr:TraR/DksA C4-type zinc finger protein [Brevibacillus laterosporus]MDF9410715.1 molecular chaperone DnaK [Brevibacillus laterosporus]